MEKPNKKTHNKTQEKKTVWTKKDYADYFKESRELSDYSCSKNGIIENRFKKNNSKKIKQNNMRFKNGNK